MQSNTPVPHTWREFYYTAAVAIFLASIQGVGAVVVGIFGFLTTRGARRLDLDHRRAETDHTRAETQHVQLETADAAIRKFWELFGRLEELTEDLEVARTLADRVPVLEAANQSLTQQNEKFKAYCTLHGIDMAKVLAEGK